LEIGKAAGKWYKYLTQQTKPQSPSHSGYVLSNPDLKTQNIDAYGTQGLVVAAGGDSCGPTTCAIAAYYYHGEVSGTAEETARNLSQKYPGGWNGSGHGSGGENLNSILSDFKVKNERSRDVGAAGVQALVEANVTRRTPMILNVGWHWVCAVEIVGGVCVVLDPWFGVTAVPLRDFPKYPHPGKAIEGWVITTSR